MLKFPDYIKIENKIPFHTTEHNTKDEDFTETFLNKSSKKEMPWICILSEMLQKKYLG
jgi:hypothetical protein